MTQAQALIAQRQPANQAEGKSEAESKPEAEGTPVAVQPALGAEAGATDEVSAKGGPEKDTAADVPGNGRAKQRGAR